MTNEYIAELKGKIVTLEEELKEEKLEHQNTLDDYTDLQDILQQIKDLI